MTQSQKWTDNILNALSIYSFFPKSASNHKITCYASAGATAKPVKIIPISRWPFSKIPFVNGTKIIALPPPPPPEPSVKCNVCYKAIDISHIDIEVCTKCKGKEHSSCAVGTNNHKTNEYVCPACLFQSQTSPLQTESNVEKLLDEAQTHDPQV